MNNEYAIYANGQPHTGWYVDTIVTKNKENATVDLSYINDDILNELDDETDEGKVTVFMASDDTIAMQQELMDEE